MRMYARRTCCGQGWEQRTEPHCGSTSIAPISARAGNRRFWLLSALRAHTKPPYRTGLHRKTLRVLNRPGRARAVRVRVEECAEPLDHPAGRRGARARVTVRRRTDPVADHPAPLGGYGQPLM
jgi:hypothetical protein